MTIQYTNKKFPPPPFDAEVAEMTYFRALYDGDHADIFPRARSIIQYETTIERWRRGKVRRIRTKEAKTEMQHQYVVVNFAGLIAEIPADLINRALGNISADTETSDEELGFIEAVVDASKPTDKIWSAVTQHQVDGRVAYRVRRNDRGKVWFEWITGDQYFPHDDEDGADIVWIEEWGDAEKKEKYLRVERQRLTDTGLTVQQLVFEMQGDTVKGELNIREYAQKYDVFVPEDLEFNDVEELLCGYVPNDETLPEPRGRSALRNVDTIQEEINWTITRDSIVFEKHGKPKLAIPKGLWDTVANQNNAHYGQRFVRNADLEVVSYDEKNGAVPMYIVWDAKMEESMKHVARLIEYMMAVSKTSPQAAGIKEAKGETGIALLYLWIQSVIKAESIQSKFDSALKDAIRKCIILENHLGGKEMEVKSPVVEWGDMMPKADSERDTEETEKYTAGVQSLETTVRRIHPDWSEEAIMAEIQKIQDEQAIDTMSPILTQPPRVRLEDDGT